MTDLASSELRFVEALSKGPLTDVWRCRTSQDVDVAVKITSPASVDRRLSEKSLAIERQVRQSFDHPGILPLDSVGPGTDGPILIGPYYPDRSLDNWVRAALPWTLAGTVIQQLADALDALHEAGWVHGDLVAANVLCDWSAGRVVLADFGATRPAGAVHGNLRQVAGESLTRPQPTGRAEARDDIAAFARLVDSLLPVPRPTAIERALRSFCIPARKPGPRAGDLARVIIAESPSVETGAHGAAIGHPTARAVAARLSDLAESLSAGERLALHSLLDSAERSVNQAAAALTATTVSVLGRAEALSAFEDAGLAQVLAGAPLSAGEAARRCQLAPAATELLLDLMAVVGVVTRQSSDGGGTMYQLDPAIRALYVGDDSGLSRPIGEARRFWGSVGTWLRSGSSAHPLDDATTDGGYAELVDVLAATMRSDADLLAEQLASSGDIADARLIVDLGAGSGVWGCALGSVVPDSRLVLFDHPQVLSARERRDPTTLSVGGDWHALPFRPGIADIVVLANVCHLEDGPGVAALIEDASRLLTPGGQLIIVDAIGGTGDPESLLQSLHLALRTKKGRVHSLAAYRQWITGSQLTITRTISLPSGLRVLCCHRHLRDEA